MKKPIIVFCLLVLFIVLLVAANGGEKIIEWFFCGIFFSPFIIILLMPFIIIGYLQLEKRGMFSAKKHHKDSSKYYRQCRSHINVDTSDKTSEGTQENPSSERPVFDIVSKKNSLHRLLESLKGWGLILIYIAVSIGLFLILFYIIKGTVWVGTKSIPWLNNIYGLTLGACILVLPLLLFRGARGFVGMTYVYASFLFGLTTWFWSLLIAYSYWDLLGVVIGILLMGVGVYPIAILACLFNSNWGTVGELLVAGILIYVVRMLGVYFASLPNKD
jgi:hypothetical protein